VTGDEKLLGARTASRNHVSWTMATAAATESVSQCPRCKRKYTITPSRWLKGYSWLDLSTKDRSSGVTSIVAVGIGLVAAATSNDIDAARPHGIFHITRVYMCCHRHPSQCLKRRLFWVACSVTAVRMKERTTSDKNKGRERQLLYARSSVSPLRSV